MTQKNDKPEAPKVETREAPIVEEDFASLLKKFRIKGDLAASIAENISYTGGQTVFEEPKLLAKRLAAWTGEIAPAKRKLILEQWFAQKGVEVPSEIIERAGLTAKEVKEAEGEKAKAPEVRYIYDTDSEQIRMAKEGEIGGTLQQAKQLKEMAEKSKETGGESPFTMDGEGNWMLNPKARITGVEFMAMESIKRAREKGEPVDPLAKLGEAAETIKTYREIFGGGGGDTPAWMRDPVELIKTVQSLTPKSEAGDAVTKELSDLKKSLDDMKDQRNREQLEAYQGQVRGLTDKVKELMDKVADVGSRASGKSEMDILGDITKEGISFIKDELPALRKDIRDGIGSGKLPGPKTPGERAARKAGFSKAIAKDKAIESLGRSLFFNEG